MPSIAYASPDQSVQRRRPAPSPLRAEIARWFDASSRTCITQFGRIYPGGSRYICVTARKQAGSFALYFFHHGPDDWRIYPPRGVGPSIVYWSVGLARPSIKAVPG